MVAVTNNMPLSSLRDTLPKSDDLNTSGGFRVLIVVFGEGREGLSQQGYLPFGGVRQFSGYSAISQTGFSFTGQRNNSYINLDDYNSRWY